MICSRSEGDSLCDSSTEMVILSILLDSSVSFNSSWSSGFFCVRSSVVSISRSSLGAPLIWIGSSLMDSINSMVRSDFDIVVGFG